MWANPAVEGLSSTTQLHKHLMDFVATSLFAFIARIISSVCFGVHLHEDSQDGEGGVPPKRVVAGLTRAEMDRLPTIVYARPTDTDECECSICMSSFDIGDELICLSCNGPETRHSDSSGGEGGEAEGEGRERREENSLSAPQAATDTPDTPTPTVTERTQGNDVKHSFHANCVRHWLMNNNTCPKCRAWVGECNE